MPYERLHPFSAFEPLSFCPSLLLVLGPLLLLALPDGRLELLVLLPERLLLLQVVARLPVLVVREHVEQVVHHERAVVDGAAQVEHAALRHVPLLLGVAVRRVDQLGLALGQVGEGRVVAEEGKCFFLKKILARG